MDHIRKLNNVAQFYSNSFFREKKNVKPNKLRFHAHLSLCRQDDLSSSRESITKIYPLKIESMKTILFNQDSAS